ncbi:MAG: hypothetical protein ACRETC_07995 [Gammaproteobacteria bacterium]
MSPRPSHDVFLIGSAGGNANGGGEEDRALAGDDVVPCTFGGVDLDA